MSTLNCDATNCVNNKGGVCGIHEVNIDGKDAHFTSEVYCEDFNNSKFKGVLNMFDNINIVSRLQSYSSTAPITSVHCTANNCFFNRNGCCNSEYLTLRNNDVNNKICCDTFIEAY